MIISPQELISWTGGTLIQGVPHPCQGVFTDSRRPIQAGFFVALCGEQFDGHDYLAQAARSGAVGALIAWERRAGAVAQTSELSDHLGRPFFLIAVPDTLVGLQNLARGERRKFSGTVIALTGSNGKTTTKEMIAAGLRRQMPVLATERNYNNDVGVPLTLLGLSTEYKACVVEMGMRGLGQIARLAAVAEPDVGVITNVGPVHMELLGSMENIARAKSELIAALGAEGAAVLNADDPLAAAMAAHTAAKVLLFSAEQPADVYAANINLTPAGSSFTLHWGGDKSAEVCLSLPGRHNVMNALAALAAVHAAGYSITEAIPALGVMAALPMRLERTTLTDGTVLINDAYNASPNSMRSALEALQQEPGRKVAVLGDMLELGAGSAKWHAEIGRLAWQCGIDLLVAIGAGGGIIADEAMRNGLPAERVLRYTDAGAAAGDITAWLQAGAAVLLKASRGIRLETVAEAVTKRK